MVLNTSVKGSGGGGVKFLKITFFLFMDLFGLARSLQHAGSLVLASVSVK